MKTVKSKFWLLAIFVAIVACAGVAGDTFVKLRISSDPGSTTIGNALVDDNVEFTVAKIVIQDVEFESRPNCADDDGDDGDDDDDDNDGGEIEYEYEGPFVVDLLTQKSKPSLDQVKLLNQTYCEFEFKMEKLDDDDIPSGISNSDEIVGQAMYLEGIYDGSTPLVVKIEDGMEFEMESEAPAGLDLNLGKLNTIFLVFDLRRVLDGIDLDGLDDVGGTIYIDKDNNQDAYQAVRNNVRAFSKLFKDSDDNDSLDDDDEVIARPIP
jgi:hypothetical protein